MQKRSLSHRFTAQWHRNSTHKNGDSTFAAYHPTCRLLQKQNYYHHFYFCCFRYVIVPLAVINYVFAFIFAVLLPDFGYRTRLVRPKRRMATQPMLHHASLFRCLSFQSFNISNRFWDIGPYAYWGHNLGFSGSRDVIGMVLWNRASISNGFRDFLP